MWVVFNRVINTTYINKFIYKFLGESRWQSYFKKAQTHHVADGQCRKSVQGSGSMRFQVPGVFIVCCEHGVVYGFHLMVDPEGRKDMFYVLYEHYPQKNLDELTVVCNIYSNSYK